MINFPYLNILPFMGWLMKPSPELFRPATLIALTSLLLALAACASPATPTPTGIPLAPSTDLPPATAGFIPFTATPSPSPRPLQTPTPIPTRPLGLERIPPAARTILPTALIPPTLLPGAECIPDNPLVMAVVVEILSGDTFKAIIGETTYTVRYIGIQAPQNDRTNTPKSTLANARLLFGKTVALIKDETDIDENGTLPRYVLVENTFANLEMVKLGMAAAHPAFPDTYCDDTFALAESDAQGDITGMWAPTPTYGPKPAFVCKCDRDRYSCSKRDFYNQRAAQACFTYCNILGAGDVHGLDRDGDGIACKSKLP